ncbi:2oxo acid dehydrogenase acyltransferase catalytic subunit [Acanthamoeba castellanii str. Neff]|uniref:2oxo acid dehydrogenase acyltransferase catalytic subunit n=1 Tax=Acanthamoeba castellanii (strain ATCC 30010 / Neff) TaxID=1257118 RepID=L8HIK0_ACACF|nr:2oxo acid dehydrogenase acyltransferase catalytic subunit [Acanthamoeba castellanii str. Neff]ELR24211.1 2oxo acid dehydrogenase acyltransferase catalytic subunit [Acanthamoeba castellanii str. Neff]
MHQSNLRLVLAGLAVYAVWGTPQATLVYLVLGLLFAFWFWWASAGMPIRRKARSIHAKISLDATKVQKYIDEKRKTTRQHITITHVVGKALGLALRNAPGLNGRIVFDRFLPFKTIDISFLAMVEGGKNLAKVKVSNIDKKGVDQVATELDAGSQRLRKGTDENFKKSMGPLKLLPTWLIRLVVNTAAYAAGALGLSIPALGVEPHPFGSCIITSVGMLGVDEAFAPFTPFARVPLLVLIGAIHEGVKVEDGETKVTKKLKLCCTIDHRFLDGAQGGAMAKVLRDVFDNPSMLDQE